VEKWQLRHIPRWQARQKFDPMRKIPFFMYSFIIYHLFSKRRIHKDTPMISVVAVAMFGTVLGFGSRE